MHRRGVSTGALEKPEVAIVGARDTCERTEGEQSFAKRVGLRELRSGVLKVEQVRLRVSAFKVENRLNEGSRLTGDSKYPLSR